MWREQMSTYNSIQFLYYSGGVGLVSSSLLSAAFIAAAFFLESILIEPEASLIAAPPFSSQGSWIRRVHIPAYDKDGCYFKSG